HCRRRCPPAPPLFPYTTLFRSPTFGGSGVVATELGLELAHRGHEIHFITYSQPVRLALLSPNVHYHQVNVPEYPLFHYQPYELRSEEHTSELQSRENLVCRLLL